MRIYHSVIIREIINALMIKDTNYAIIETWKGFLSPPIKNISLTIFKIHAPKELTRSFRFIYLSVDTFGSNIISNCCLPGPLEDHDNRDG